MSETSQEIVKITPRAARKASELLERRGLGDHGIRVSIDYRGNDPSYSLEFADEPLPSDRVVESNGMELFVDRDSEAALEGSTIDYVVEGGRGGFTIQDPGEEIQTDYDESTLEGRVRKFLATNFPQIHGHGGEAIIEELNEESGYLKLSLEGACESCGISNATAQAIKKNLPESVEGIKKVEIDTGDEEYMDIDTPF